MKILKVGVVSQPRWIGKKGTCTGLCTFVELGANDSGVSVVAGNKAVVACPKGDHNIIVDLR